jgi:hypothetical protein
MIPALQERSRRSFWYFLRCKNVPDDRFNVFYAAKSFPTIVLVFSTLQKELK